MAKILKTAPQDPNNRTPDPLMAMVFFFVATSIYCVVGIFLTDSHQRLIAKICYTLFVVVGEFFINLTLTQQLCGVSQWRSTMFVTLIPWLMLFGVLHLFLMIFPGWMAPFANTFGYLVAKLMGLPDLMKALLVEQPTDLTTEASKALESIRSDNSLFINELYAEPGSKFMQKLDKNGLVFDDDKKTKPTKATEEDIKAGKSAVYKVAGKPVFERPVFDKAWDKLMKGKIIKDPSDEKLKNEGYDIEHSEKHKSELYHFVNMKYTISEYVWNLLTGFLVTSISYNYIINTGCARSPKEMKDRYDRYEAEQEQKKKAKDAKADKEPKYVQNA